MSAVPADIDTGVGPPTAVPLRHFLVGFGFLLAEALPLPTAATVAGGTLVTLGLLVSCVNLALVVYRHAGPVRDLLVPAVI